MMKTRILKRTDGKYEPQVQSFWGKWKPVIESLGHAVSCNKVGTAIDILVEKFGKHHDFKGLVADDSEEVIS